MPYRSRARAVARPIGFTAAIALLAALLTVVGVAPASAEGTGSISGTVTNSQGEPLPNARVRVFTTPAYDHLLNVVGWTTTDEQGHYTLGGLSARNYGIHVYGPEGTEYLGEVWENQRSYGTATVISLAEGEARDGIDLQLAIAAVVTGVITDADGDPIPGAYARFTERYPPRNTSAIDRSVKADESGVYEIRRLNPGVYSVTFSAAASASSETGYVTVRAVQVEAKSDAVVRQDMTMAKASVIRGTVTNVRGEDVGSVSADLWRLEGDRWYWLDTTTNYQYGSYSFAGLPAGVYAVEIDSRESSSNYAPQWWGGRQARWAGEDANQASPSEIELGTGVTFAADLVLDSGAWVRGSVRDEQGDPIGSKRVVLHLQRDGGWQAFKTTWSRADGTFELDRVPAGTYTVEFPGQNDLLPEWWTDATSQTDSKRIEIPEGAVISGIDAVLGRQAVTVSGPARVGATLTVDAVSGPPGASFAYEWLVDGVPLPDRTSAALELEPGHLGRMITVRVTTSAPGYGPVVSESAPVGPVEPGALSTGTPTIGGIWRLRSVLVAHPGAWTDGTSFAYRWFADGVVIPGATHSILRLTSTEVGKSITVEVTGTKSGFSDASVVSGPSAAVTKDAIGPATSRPQVPPPTSAPVG